MPLAFPHFPFHRPSPPTTQAAEAEGASATVTSESISIESSNKPLPIKSPFPIKSSGAVPPPLPTMASNPNGPNLEAADTIVFPPLPITPPHAGTWLPDKLQAKGLAALAVHQSSTEAPPMNRRTPTQGLPAMYPFPVVAPNATQETLPAPSYWSSTSEIKMLESLEVLRVEFQKEIEEVKGDLFGAAMGVSALKDRLDGLESQITQQQPSPAQAQTLPNRADVESWVSTWLDEHLPSVLDRFVTAAHQSVYGTLSTNAWFRQPVNFPPADRHSFLAQPPIILADTPV